MMWKVWIGVVVVIAALSYFGYYQTKKNGELSVELKAKQATIEQTEKDIKDLAFRLSAAQEIARIATQKHQERVRNPDVSVDALERLIEETSR